MDTTDMVNWACAEGNLGFLSMVVPGKWTARILNFGCEH